MALSGAEKARRYRARRKGHTVTPLRPGRPPKPLSRWCHDPLEVTCWCEDFVMLVPRAEVLAGRTRSCGAPRCKEAA